MTQRLGVVLLFAGCISKRSPPRVLFFSSLQSWLASFQGSHTALSAASEGSLVSTKADRGFSERGEVY